MPMNSLPAVWRGGMNETFQPEITSRDGKGIYWKRITYSMTCHWLSTNLRVYEELSLLYRISEIYSLSALMICSRIIDEAISTISVKTAAVLFDEKRDNLYTKAYKGIGTATGNS
jgi:hypothetical protein